MAGSKRSRRASAGSSAESTRTNDEVLGIGPARLELAVLLPRRRTLVGAFDERRVEVPRFAPESGPGRADPVAALRDRLVPGADLFVPAVDQPVPLEARHQLIERRSGALHAVRGDGLADDTSRPLPVAPEAEDEDLQVRQPRDPLRRHKVTLSTITLDGAAAPRVGVRSAFGTLRRPAVPGLHVAVSAAAAVPGLQVAGYECQCGPIGPGNAQPWHPLN